jgi:hypothetical protein
MLYASPKHLLSRLFRVVAGRIVVALARPVTPEVAGSRPVASVSQSACKQALSVVRSDAQVRLVALEPGRVFDRTGSIEDVPDGYRAMNDREVRSSRSNRRNEYVTRSRATSFSGDIPEHWPMQAPSHRPDPARRSDASSQSRLAKARTI